jgi:hypothetical protein
MVVYGTKCEKCNIDEPTIRNSGRISLKSILDEARHLDWPWPGPFNLEALHFLITDTSGIDIRKLIFGRLLPHRFGPGPLQRTFFERAVPPKRSGTTRLDDTVQIKMESVQNAHHVNFYLIFPPEHFGIRKKFDLCIFIFPEIQRNRSGMCSHDHHHRYIP